MKAYLWLQALWFCACVNAVLSGKEDVLSGLSLWLIFAGGAECARLAIVGLVWLWKRYPMPAAKPPILPTTRPPARNARIRRSASRSLSPARVR